jgi:drug/metabolite transporter (DMT)-like permease
MIPVPVLLAALAAVVLWGASAVATKIAVTALAPLAVAALRTIIGGLIALPLALALRLPLPGTVPQRYVLLLSAACGFIAFPVLFSLGVRLTSANHASMILAALPIFTGAIAMAWDRRWPKRVWWVGCAIALVGEMLLIANQPIDTTAQASLSGDLIVLAGNLFASLGYVAGGRLQREGYPSTGTTFWGAGLAAVILLPTLPFIVDDIVFAEIAPASWLGVLYLAIGVTIVGYVLWYWALGKGGIERIGLIQFLQPISGVILAWLLLGERVDFGFVLASGMVLIGVWVSIQTKDKT